MVYLDTETRPRYPTRNTLLVAFSVIAYPTSRSRLSVGLPHGGRHLPTWHLCLNQPLPALKRDPPSQRELLRVCDCVDAKTPTTVFSRCLLVAPPTMASAELIVAKTALSGALFRPDPRPCSRDDIESMFALVNSTITECSPLNVQV